MVFEEIRLEDLTKSKYRRGGSWFTRKRVGARTHWYRRNSVAKAGVRSQRYMGRRICGSVNFGAIKKM